MLASTFPTRREEPMRKIIAVLVVLSVARLCSAYSWTTLGPEGMTILDCHFHPFLPNSILLCTPEGVFLDDGFQWNRYSVNNSAVWSAAPFDSSNVLLAVGDVGASAGIHVFDIFSNQFAKVHSCDHPHFVIRSDVDNTYYAGHGEGLLVSFNGIDWHDDDFFDDRDCVAMGCHQDHVVISADDTVFLADNSSDPQFGGQIDMGLIEYGPINEASGIVSSRRNRDVLWTHNDSGDLNRVFAFNSQGTHLGVYTIHGVSNRDWEDIAMGYESDSDQYYLYVADFGDNNHVHDLKYIHKILEPEVSSSQSPVSDTLYVVETSTFLYPNDIRHNAETLIIDPLTGDIYVITKRGGEADDKVFRSAFPQSTTLVDTLDAVATVVTASSSPAVGGDISPSGLEILVKDYSHIYYWTREPGQALWEAFDEEPVVLPYTSEPQGEAVCWKPNCLGYYTVSEESGGNPAYLYFYSRERWFEAQTGGVAISSFDFDQDGKLYGVSPDSSLSSGLWSSGDFGDNWDVEFLTERLSSVVVDSNGVVFVGWSQSNRDSTGVAVWATEISNLAFANQGLPGGTVSCLRRNPLLGVPAVTACTDSGALSIIDYFSPMEMEIQLLDVSNCRLHWTTVPAVTHYDIYRDTSHYLSASGTPWHTAVAPVTYFDFTGGIGDEETNYSFIGIGRRGANTTQESNTVGEFEYGLP